MAGPTQPLRCVRCGEPLLPAYMANCPRCGLPVQVSVQELTPAAGNWGAAGEPQGQEAQGYGEPQGFGSGTYGQPAGPSYPLYGQPAGPSVPLYGQYGQAAAPSAPIYGQGAPPSVPMPLYGQYGQPAGPSVPMPGYGQPAGPSVPFYGQPPYGGMPPMAEERPERQTGLIVTLVVVLVVLIGGASAAIVALSGKGQQSATTGGGTTATATAMATATAASSVIYKNSLTSHPAGWPSAEGCSPQSDGYHVTASISCLAPTDKVGDFKMVVTVKPVGAGTSDLIYGVTFRSNTQGISKQLQSTYGLVFDKQGDWAFLLLNGSDRRVVLSGQANRAVHTDGSANTIEVDAKGSHFTFLVNGTKLGESDDATVESGYCGLQGSDGNQVVFTNLTITSL